MIGLLLKKKKTSEVAKHCYGRYKIAMIKHSTTERNYCRFIQFQSNFTSIPSISLITRNVKASKQKLQNENIDFNTILTQQQFHNLYTIGFG